MIGHIFLDFEKFLIQNILNTVWCWPFLRREGGLFPVCIPSVFLLCCMYVSTALNGVSF